MIDISWKLEKLRQLRERLNGGGSSVGSWLQIESPNLAEIMANGNFDWIVVDLEHGLFDLSRLPEIFRALELGGVLPMARMPSTDPTVCKSVLDSGAVGLIFPNIDSADQIRAAISASCWPPQGRRGVGYCRGNNYGESFDSFQELSQEPFIVAMIENFEAISQISQIAEVRGVDALLIGPYDLSASLGVTSCFDSAEFQQALDSILAAGKDYSVPVGIHVVEPDVDKLRDALRLGYQFIPFSMDSAILTSAIRQFKQYPYFSGEYHET